MAQRASIAASNRVDVDDPANRGGDSLEIAEPRCSGEAGKVGNTLTCRWQGRLRYQPRFSDSPSWEAAAKMADTVSRGIQNPSLDVGGRQRS